MTVQVSLSEESCDGTGPCNAAAIVLAAGCSRRMGADNKLLLEVEGSTLVRSSVQSAIASNAKVTIVVLGYEAEDAITALDGLEYQAAMNADYLEGMSSSIRTGVQAAEGFDAVAILLADMPCVEPKILNTLLTVYSRQKSPAIVVATHTGRRGHPVIWSADFFPDLMALRGDVGGKKLLEKYSRQVVEVEVDSNSIFMDIDTPADIKAANSLRAATS